MAEKFVLIIEDNKDLVADVNEIAIAQGWKVKSARCVNEGVEAAKALRVIKDAASDTRILVILDLMLPISKDELNRLDDLVQERERLVMTYLAANPEAGLSGDTVTQARTDLERLDQQIRRLIDMEGGIHLLTVVKEWLAEWDVAVFSARGPKDLRAKICKALGRNNIPWIQKGLDSGEIGRLLREIESRIQ